MLEINQKEIQIMVISQNKICCFKDRFLCLKMCKLSCKSEELRTQAGPYLIYLILKQAACLAAGKMVQEKFR